MRFLLKTLIAVAYFTALPALAQTGGSVGSLPQSASSSAPLQAAPGSVIVRTPAPSFSTPPSPIVSGTPIPVLPLSSVAYPDSSNSNYPPDLTPVWIAVAVGVGLVGGYAAFKSRLKKQEKNSGRCDSIKELLEQKKKELEDMVKNWPKDKVKKVLEEGITDEIEKNEETKQILRIKEKYDKAQGVISMLQKKYDLCMLELSLMSLTKAVIFDLNGVLIEPGFNSEIELPGIVDLVKDLKSKGFKLFIISNIVSDQSGYYEKNFPFLNDLFDKSYYSWQTGFIKPDERAYTMILSENNLKPEECIYFDDSEENVKAASEIGIRSYLFKDSQTARKILLG